MGQSTPQLRGPSVTTIFPTPQDLRVQSPFLATFSNRTSETPASMWGRSRSGDCDAFQQLMPFINPAWDAVDAHEQTHMAATRTATHEHTRSNHTTTTHMATASQAERVRLLHELPASALPSYPSHPAGSTPLYLLGPSCKSWLRAPLWGLWGLCHRQRTG